MPPPPANSIYEKKWPFTLPRKPSTNRSTAPGMPNALAEYKKGWDGWSGTIPTDRKDMWTIFYNYYLNAIQDVDRSITADRRRLERDGFVAGYRRRLHGRSRRNGRRPWRPKRQRAIQLRGKRPRTVDRRASGRRRPAPPCSALTSHLDLLPTFVGLTGLPESKRPAAVKAMPGPDFSRCCGSDQSRRARGAPGRAL